MSPDLRLSNANRPDKAATVSKAVLRAADQLGLSARRLSEIVGVSEATVSRMKRGGYVLDPASKSFELAVLLLRLFRSLDAITGGDRTVAQAWLRNTNTALGGRPLDRIASIAGLLDVIAYLDSRRAVV
jgi:hypothetical protein